MGVKDLRVIGLLMDVRREGRGLARLFFFLSLTNFFYLHKKIFFLVKLSLGRDWIYFLSALGIFNSWEVFFGAYGEQKVRCFLRYRGYQPLGFFSWTSSFFQGGQVVSYAALRAFSAVRPGVTLLLLTSKGLLTTHECLRLRSGGILVSVLV